MEMNAWSCSVGTIDNSPAIYRRENGPVTIRPKGRLRLEALSPQPFLGDWRNQRVPLKSIRIRPNTRRTEK